MEDFLVWLFWAVIIGGSIASSAAKAKKQREEAARKAAAKAAKAAKGQAATVKPAPGTVKPAAGGSFGKVLEELSRQLTEQPSPTVVVGRKTIPWPATASQPAATSHDYRSLEQDYDAMDGREYRGDWSAESVEDEVTAYERLADQRARRLSPVSATAAASGAAVGAAVGVAGAVGETATSAVAAQDMFADQAADNQSTTLYELLGGDFDLRRAVIEAEILTPKYAASY